MNQFSVEKYLRDFHDRRPGATSRCFGVSETVKSEIRYPSPYLCLTEVVPCCDEPLTALDLACGDGYLLAELAARNQKGLSLIGVDMSQGELTKARERLGDGAMLLLERAQTLSVPTASVDIVVSHMALMLMDDADAVMAEIRRVLKPKGTFSAVISGRPSNSPVFALWISLLKSIRAADGAPAVRFGDQRTRTVEGLLSLFEVGFSDPHVFDLEVNCDADAAGLWDWFSHTYDADQLSPDAKVLLRAKFLTEATSLANSDGVILCRDYLRQMTATVR